MAGGIKLDIRRLRPGDVISIALSPEKQDQQNVRKLKSLNDSDWGSLVDAIAHEGNSTDINLVKRILRLEESQEAEAFAARANMTNVVNMLHDRSSQMLDMLLAALKRGSICVIDVSQMRGSAALVLSGLILNHIFQHNQAEFTEGAPDTIPTIAVIEEAQSVLGSGGSSGEGPYVAWVKEGRKYDLGAVMITQQPGSISTEILSQGDNWFVFHLLSAVDLHALRNANSHFSDDLLSSLLNEPIPGNCVFWSSSGGKPYPIPMRVFSFEERFKVLDPDGKSGETHTLAAELRRQFAAIAADIAPEQPAPTRAEMSDSESPADGVDVLNARLQQAFAALQADQRLMNDLRTKGLPWGVVMGRIKDNLPPQWHDRENVAYRNVPRFLNETLGKDKWDTESRPKPDGSGTRTWVRVNP